PRTSVTKWARAPVPRLAGAAGARCRGPSVPRELDLPATPPTPLTASPAPRETSPASPSAPSAAAAAGDDRHLLARQHLVVLASVPAAAIGTHLRHVRDALAPVRRRFHPGPFHSHPRPILPPFARSAGR